MKTIDRVSVMFESGKDTYDIAQAIGISEAQASMFLHRARCKDLGLAVNVEASRSCGIATQQWWVAWFAFNGLMSPTAIDRDESGRYVKA